MIRIIFLILFLPPLFLVSCKKDELKGDKSILEGKWKWIYTTGNKTPASEGKNYSVEFLKCGKIIFYENGEEKEKQRIVFASYDPLEHPLEIPGWYFEIYLNNKGSKSIQGSIYDRTYDTLKLRGDYGYPFSGWYDQGGYQQYINYFVREI